MIHRRLIEREHDDFAVRISDIGIAGDVETRDMAHAVPKRPAGSGVIDVKAAVGCIVRIKGKSKQTLLVAARLDPGVNVEKRCRIHRPRGEINDENLARLLDDENPAGVGRGRGHVEREGESRGDSLGGDADGSLSVRWGERECHQCNGRRGRESPQHNRFRFRAHSPFYPPKHENVNPAIVSGFRKRRPFRQPSLTNKAFRDNAPGGAISMSPRFYLSEAPGRCSNHSRPAKKPRRHGDRPSSFTAAAHDLENVPARDVGDVKLAVGVFA
jgi:hypothetical protein